jgi:surfactin family lipopeptide synthetase B/lichenysin synthetase B
MHHIISDGTSTGIFAGDFMAYYQGEILPPINIQFKDYLEWQGRKEQQKWLKEQEDYWLNEFKEGIPVMELPYDFKRPASRNFEGNTIDFHLDRESTAKIKVLALEEEVTLFQLLITIFNILMSKISGQEDIVVGMALMNRRYVELQGVICLLADSLAIRNRPQGHKTFREFLKEVKEKTLEVYEHQHYPFGDLVEKLSLKRDAGRNPIFDVQFQFENMDIPEIKIPDLNLVQYGSKTNIAKLDMLLYGFDAGENVRFSIEYSTKLFKEDTIRKWITYFQTIVATIQKNPGIKLSSIEITSDKRKKDVIKEFLDDLENEYEFAAFSAG